MYRAKKTLPLIKIEKIARLKEIFSWQNDLTVNQNISILAEKYLISILKNNGYSFDFTILRTEKGKPYFQYNKDLHFSISHIKNYIAIAIDNTQVGIDIEHIRKYNPNLAKRFFHPNEVKYLNSVCNYNSENKNNKEGNRLFTTDYDGNVFSDLEHIKDFAFTQLWTIKESYVKMTGTGIAGNFSNTDLSLAEFRFNNNITKDKYYIDTNYLDKEQLFASVCRKRINKLRKE